MTLRIPVPFWRTDTRVEIRLRLLFGLLPVWLFLAVSRVAPPWAAISAGFLATVAVYYTADRNRLVGGLITFSFVVVAAASGVGILWSSEKAYLASGPITDFLFVPVYALSPLLRRPLVGGLSRELVPTIAGRLPLDHVLYRLLSFAWAAYYALHGLVQVWLLRELSVAQFVILSRAILWPPTGLALLLTAAAIWRTARRVAEPLATASPARDTRR